MDIVFVRHAQAGDGSAQMDDLGRELTQKGRREFEKSIPRLKRQLDPDKRTAIWTSPAARAMQTARIIADKLQITDITRHEWIYTGDFDAFYAALHQPGEKALLFIVGHQPHLSLWAEQLSGISVPFKKGAMACFVLNPTASPKAELRWTMQAGTLKDENMPVRHVSINDFKKAMIGRLLDISKWHGRVLNKPNDAESIHQLRVSLRQARSLLLFIKPMVEGEAYRSAQAELKASADKLSSIREIDVLLAQRRAYLREKKPVSGCKALAMFLKSRREEERSAIIAHLSSDLFTAALGGITSWVLLWVDIGQDASGFGLFAVKRFEKWRQDANDAVKEPDADGCDELHRLRIKLKNLHNIRESVHLPEWDKWMDLTQLKMLQRDLGEICDAYASAALLRQMDSAFDTQKLKAEAAILTAYLLDLGMALKRKYLLTGDRLSDTLI